ncbi:MAG: alpha/beta hydrolase [Nocardioidaceae bacterium]|nr:alpha/beta hydrolase [Nocardioidaceae bacterium]
MVGTLPIIYVRGFAGDTSGIDQAVDDPFYGLNLGSTHVRVGGRGDPVFYQFESPLLRLITDHQYRLLVEGGQEGYLDSQAEGTVEQASLWIHRFYDASASTWSAEPVDFSVESAAKDLLRFVEKVLSKTGAPRVHLVAHSMGGLISRSMIQRTIPETYSAQRLGAQQRYLAAHFVDRLFTYGTPHGGIEFDVGFGLFEKVRDDFGLGGGDIFGPQRMYEYLTPADSRESQVPEKWDARVMPNDENFPLERVFCVVGTNARDYPAAHGLSSKVVGPKSDGLVQIQNALVTGANHAYVHRSHSGRYGLVNSEEGYQNLARFLFGDVKVTADLIDLAFPDDEELTWQAEAQVSIRGLPILMHEQAAAHYCPILIEKRRPEDPADRPVPLVTTYMSSTSSRPEQAPTMRYTLHIRVLSLRERKRGFFWEDHQEQTSDFDDTLIIDVGFVDRGMAAWAAWASQITTPLRSYRPSGNPLTDEDPKEGTWMARVALPPGGRFFGERAALSLRVRNVV